MDQVRSPDGLLTDRALQALEEAAQAGQIPELLEVLDRGEERERARAAFSLASTPGASGDMDVEEALLQALLDTSASVRADAAFALGRLAAWGAGTGDVDVGPGPQGVEGEVRTHVGVPLMGRRRPEVERGMVAALAAEEDDRVRAVLADALGFVGAEDALPVLLEEEVARGAASLAMARIVLRTVGERRWGGGGTPAEVDPAAATSLAATSLDGAVDLLADRLTDHDAGVRGAASWFFWSVQDEELLKWASTRLQEAVTLTRLQEAVTSLSPHDPAMIQAADALGRIAGPADLSFWIDLAVHSHSPPVRMVAVRTLGRSGLLERDGVRDLLWERVEADPSDAVASEAARGLLGGFRIPAATLTRALDFLERTDVGWVRQVPFLVPVAMLRSPEPISAWTRRRLTASEGEAAAWGIEALGLLSDPPITHELFSFFEEGDGDPWVTLAVTRALNGRWERLWEGPEAMDRYQFFFQERIRTGEVPTAVHAVRALAHPVFAEMDAEERVLEALRERMELGGSVRPVIREAWAAFSTRRGPPFFLDWDGSAFRELDPGAIPRELRAGSQGPEASTAGEGVAVGFREFPEDIFRPFGSRPVLVLEMAQGSVAFQLLPEEAPRSTEALIRRVTAGELAGTPWHRGTPGRVMQGGDGIAHDGTGRDVLPQRMEPTMLAFSAGTLGVAWEAGKPLGTGLNLFVTIVPEFGFDGGYTAIGRVVVGTGVLHGLLPTDRILRACILPNRSPKGLPAISCTETEP